MWFGARCGGTGSEAARGHSRVAFVVGAMMLVAGALPVLQPVVAPKQGQIPVFFIPGVVAMVLGALVLAVGFLLQAGLRRIEKEDGEK